MRLQASIAAIVASVGLFVLSTAANAQTTQTATAGSSGRLWGTASANGGTDSSNMHTLDGNAAAQVNAARQGFLLGTATSMSITSIGSQTIVSTTVVGNSNATNVTATQTSSNAGNVTTNGLIAATTTTSTTP